MRKFSTTGAQEQIKEVVRRQNWDYRWQNVPYRVSKCDKHVEGDTSLMTYRGHNVLQTLIRCHFSPQFSTGQRYIYTGFYFRFLQINKMLTLLCLLQLTFDQPTTDLFSISQGKSR